MDYYDKESYYDKHMDGRDDPYCIWRNSDGRSCNPTDKAYCDRCLARVYGEEEDGND